jgi:hypothetical protein
MRLRFPHREGAEPRGVFPRRLARRLAGVRAEWWLGLLLALLVMAFLGLPLTEPGSVGRGGR